MWEIIRKDLKEKLATCTEKQQEFFHRMYPEGIDEIKNNKLGHAYNQVERTIKKNKEVK